jgi:hypothetical protein
MGVKYIVICLQKLQKINPGTFKIISLQSVVVALSKFEKRND